MDCEEESDGEVLEIYMCCQCKRRIYEDDKMMGFWGKGGIIVPFLFFEHECFGVLMDGWIRLHI